MKRKVVTFISKYIEEARKTIHGLEITDMTAKYIQILIELASTKQV
jgi:hypothetical protein